MEVEPLQDFEDPLADMDFSFTGTPSASSILQPSPATIAKVKITLQQVLSLDVFSLFEQQKCSALSAIATLISSASSPSIKKRLGALSSFISSIFSSFKTFDSRVISLKQDIGKVMGQKEAVSELMTGSKACIAEHEEIRSGLALRDKKIKALKQEIEDLEQEKSDLFRRGQEVELRHREMHATILSLSGSLKDSYSQLKVWNEECTVAEQRHSDCIIYWRNLSGSFDFQTM